MLDALATKDILKIGIEITTEKNKDRLLEKMLNKAMEISGCDAGTLYVTRNGMLFFKIMKTLSMNVSRGAEGEAIELPPVEYKEENVCAYSAIHRELVNIPDVYSSDKFDFSGPKKYDGITGYHTRSMLVIPMEDAEGQVIGVIQLINKLNKSGEIISFTDDDAFILRSLGSMAAVSLSNMIYLEDIKRQMQSFVQAFATAVDKRTPYNGSHTRMVTEYAVRVAKRLNELYESERGGEPFDERRIEQLSLAAGLHDIGKMVIPLSVMNKSSRLEGHIDKIRDRFNYIRAISERDMLKGIISKKRWRERLSELDEDEKTILEINSEGFLTDEMLSKINVIAEHYYVDSNDTVIYYLNEPELESLRTRKGTLTENERRIMESHVEMTETILERVYFTETYKDALRFASEHHEYLDGSGYPKQLKGEELSTETRILTVVDVFDALTCSDRPYKKPMSQSRAINILKCMAAEGKLDGRIVSVLDEVTFKTES